MLGDFNQGFLPYHFRRDSHYVSGEWDNTEVVDDQTNKVVGLCTRRSGGGWFCQLEARPKGMPKVSASGRGDDVVAALAAAHQERQRLVDPDQAERNARNARILNL